MTNSDPDRRPTARTLLLHPWMSQLELQVSTSVIDNREESKFSDERKVPY